MIVKSELIDRLEVAGAEMLALAAELKTLRTELGGVSKEALADVEREHGPLARRLVEELDKFDIAATVLRVDRGPVTTRIVFSIPSGIRYSAVTSLKDNLMGAFGTAGIRIEAPVYGENALAIEIPHESGDRKDVLLAEMLKIGITQPCALPLFLGTTSAGEPAVEDLSRMPHLIIGGATGQGKTVLLGSFICGLVANLSPEELRLVLVDPKCVEYTGYATLPHLAAPIITDSRKFVMALRWAVLEMEKRLKLFARAQCRNIADFNASGNDKVPYVVIIVDEIADMILASSKELLPDISRLTAKARAAGIHLVLATQRPDAKVLSGMLKANIPGRIAFKTATSVDSRTILDAVSAEDLVGRGDMLYRNRNGELVRIQGAYVNDHDIGGIVSVAVRKYGKFNPMVDLVVKKTSRTSKEQPRDMRKAISDYDMALEVVRSTGRASIVHLQRRLGFGYNHAAELIDMLENNGIIGPQIGAGPREVFFDKLPKEEKR